MVRFPFAKINLGLQVLRRRDDGFHDIASVLVPIALHDVLEVVVDPALGTNAIAFERTGIPVPGAKEQDLCFRAVRKLQALGDLPGIRVHLHKVIPIGAGLGGGSSDGAHMLLLLNELLSLGLSVGTLTPIAGELGSDCSFFLNHEAQLAEGRGERLTRIDLDMEGIWLVLINPGIHVSTAEVFRNTHPSDMRANITDLVKAPLDHWQAGVVNDMEPYVFGKHLAIARIQGYLLVKGAIYAAMSGSGSSVFGLFKKKPEPDEYLGHWSTWILPLNRP